MAISNLFLLLKQSIVDIDTQKSQVGLRCIEEPNLPPKTFTFDGAYGIDSNTESIYNDLGFPLVESVSLLSHVKSMNYDSLFYSILCMPIFWHKVSLFSVCPSHRYEESVMYKTLVLVAPDLNCESNIHNPTWLSTFSFSTIKLSTVSLSTVARHLRGKWLRLKKLRAGATRPRF